MTSDTLADPEKYIRVNDSVASRRDLLPIEKLLLSLIVGLSVRDGHCQASNGYLATRLGMDAKYISELITGLKKRDLIVVEIDKFSGNTRRIYLCTALQSPPDTPFLRQGATPIRSGQDTSPATAAQGIPPQPEISPAVTGDPPLSQQERRLKTDQSKIKEEKKEQMPADGEAKQMSPSVFPEKIEDKQKPPRQTIALAQAEMIHRAAWELLDADRKRPFLDAATCDLSAAGLGDPPTRAVEPRAFHLYAKASALAFIEQQREIQRQAQSTDRTRRGTATIWRGP